ncbi:MAG: FMN-binding protein [Candidatus Paceibacterota bacterium]|jgi:uncharacterized protein with FMN-binding domain
MPPQRISSGKLPLAIVIGIVSATYTLWQFLGGEQQSVVVTAPITSNTTQPIAAQNVPTQTATTTTQSPKPLGLYRDGTYVGTPADAYYGTVQVQAIIQNGKIADVKFLQHPSDRSTSVAVNNYAMPILIREAIVAQNARVDTASGATFTSEAFQQSLASALTQAKN